jgi:hypothetical protein
VLHITIVGWMGGERLMNTTKTQARVSGTPDPIVGQVALPRNGGYCSACGRTMHTQTRILVAHKPEADHIYCMWCGVRLPIVPSEEIAES